MDFLHLLNMYVAMTEYINGLVLKIMQGVENMISMRAYLMKRMLILVGCIST